jgi:ectoine hydroxylase-related dioxygenase (phytanoyl-CoA dioxygenase family)
MQVSEGPRIVRLGTADVVFPSAELQQIEDSAPLLGAGDGGAQLRARFARDGFVFLRGALGGGAVRAARAAVAAHLAATGGVFTPGSTTALAEGCGLGCLPFLEGRNDVTHHPAVAGVLEGAPLRAAVGALLGTAELRTFDYKWLRAMPRASFTGAHVDAVYMARGSPRLLTCWVPFEDAATLELGALAVCKGSHAAPELARVRETYGRLDTEGEPGFVGSGWLTEDPRDRALPPAARQWVSGDFAAGDVIIFGMHTLHMSTANLTNNVRISCDVRWQPAGEAVDERYVGTQAELLEKAAQRKKGGAWVGGASAGADVTMASLREKWGL